MEFEIVFEMEEDGRWIAEIESLPGVLAYGASQLEAQSKVEALALRVLTDLILVLLTHSSALSMLDLLMRTGSTPWIGSCPKKVK